MQDVADVLDLLPPEAVQKILLKASLADLISFCRTSTKAAEWCQNELFWAAKYQQDFGVAPEIEGVSWKERYQDRASIEIVNSPVSISGGHYGLIDDQGILYMAGINENGQLGNGIQIDLKIPIPITSFTSPVISVSCGANFTMAVTEDGRVYGWGLNIFGGDDDILTPTLIEPLKELVAIRVVCASISWAILLKDYSVYYSVYHLVENVRHESKLTLKDKVIDISTNGFNLVAVTNKGNVYIIGTNFSGGSRLGVSMVNNVISVTPAKINLPEKIKQVSSSVSHMVFLSTEGNMFIWGSNENGKLGLSSKVDTLTSPTKLGLPAKISYVTSSLGISAAITIDGRLYMWGDNILVSTGFYIDGRRSNDDDHLLPMEIDIGFKINYIAIDSSTVTIAITTDGVANYWGPDGYYLPDDTNG